MDYSDTESSDDEDNIRPPPRKRRPMVIYSDDEDDEEQQSSVSTEKQQSSVSTEKPSRKRKASGVSDITPKKRRLDTRLKKTANLWKEAFYFQLFSPQSCKEMVTENMYKPISCDVPDSIVHIH